MPGLSPLDIQGLLFFLIRLSYLTVFFLHMIQNVYILTHLALLARDGPAKEHPSKISSNLFYLATVIIHGMPSPP